jgi:hypothetical protein
MNKIKPDIKTNLKISLMISQISCITNIPKMNSNKAGTNFQVRPIAIKKSNIDICSGF